MAESTATTWTCDRCGTTDETNQGGQPTHWAGVVLVTPPRGDTNEAKRRHLCLPCRRQFDDSFMNPPQAADS